MFKGALLIALSAVVAAEDLTEDNFRYPGDGTGGGRPVGGFNEGGLVEREDRGTTVAPPFIPPTVCSSQITKWTCMVSKLFLRALFINSASLPAFRSRRSHAAPGSYLIHALEVQHIRTLPVQSAAFWTMSSAKLTLLHTKAFALLSCTALKCREDMHPKRWVCMIAPVVV